ncbi:MAG TPA: hypothetical protein VFY59_05940 [Rubrobacter sp.]|nr:hypothetical protein [Rubrobacter sp.]
MTVDTKKRETGGNGAAVWLAWSLAALSVAIFSAASVLSLLPRPSAGDPSAINTSGDTVGYVLFLAFPIVGAVIASRRPRNPIGWILLADGLLWMVLAVADSYSAYGVARPGSVPYPVAVGTISNQWLWIPTVGLIGIYLLLLFPDGKLPSSRWRPLAFFSAAMILLSGVVEGLAPGPLENQGMVRNPFGVESMPWLVDASYVLLPLLPLCILASAISMVLRYRRSGGEVRQQIKWVAFVAAFSGTTYLIAMLGQLIMLALSEEDISQVPWWVEIAFAAAVLGFAGVPVAIGFAVLKYRLYDIDIIIRRTLVYGSLTAMLVAIYFGGVATMQTLFRTLTGQEQQPQLSVVVSTLVIAALFNPLRRGIQSFIDRRFYRRKYDARKTVEAFSARLRDETDLETLSRELAGVVEETLQPSHVSLWLRS